VIGYPFRFLQKYAVKDSSLFCVELEPFIFGEFAFMVKMPWWSKCASSLLLLGRAEPPFVGQNAGLFI